LPVKTALALHLHHSIAQHFNILVRNTTGNVLTEIIITWRFDVPT